MGAYMLLFPRARIRTLLFLGIFIQVVRVPAAVMLGYWMLIQVLSGFAEYGTRTGSGIAWFAHIGGFVTGFFLGILMRRAKGRSQLSRTRFLGQRR
jgi:membrane associated rhomboid family serine protease